jgi:prepilin-type N-terminal cleavage/methylation domain-containing protein
MDNKLPEINGQRLGFTLIELLIVIAIVAVLSTVVIISFPGALKSARDGQRRSDLKQYQTALEVYANKNNGSYPAYPGITRADTTLCAALLLSNCAKDPLPTTPYYYYGNGTQYVVYATLERKDSLGATNYWIVCSNGQSGSKASVPANSNCPL